MLTEEQLEKKVKRLAVLDEILHDGFCEAHTPEKAVKYKQERKELLEELSTVEGATRAYRAHLREWRP